MDGMKRALDTRKVDMRALKVASSTILTLAIMAAIFSFSAQSGGESGSLSDAVARMLASAFVGGFDAMPSEQQAQLIAQMSWPIRKTAPCVRVRLPRHIARHHVLADCSMAKRGKGRSGTLPTTYPLRGRDGVRPRGALCVQ